MKLLDRIINQAKEDRQTIVLPEGKDKRVVEAARRLHLESIVNVIVLVSSADYSDELRNLQELFFN